MSSDISLLDRGPTATAEVTAALAGHRELGPVSLGDPRTGLSGTGPW